MAQYQPMYDSFNRHPEKYVPNARISVSPNVHLPSGEIDFYTGQAKPDHLRRRRTQAKRLEREELDRKLQKNLERDEQEQKKGGVRVLMSTGMLIICGVMFVCAMILIAQRGRLEILQAQINDQHKTIETYLTANQELEGRIKAASDPSVICYNASQRLNMIPASSVQAIHLSAVDTRPLETARQQQIAARTEEPLSAESTPIPITASN